MTEVKKRKTVQFLNNEPEFKTLVVVNSFHMINVWQFAESPIL